MVESAVGPTLRRSDGSVDRATIDGTKVGTPLVGLDDGSVVKGTVGLILGCFERKQYGLIVRKHILGVTLKGLLEG